MTTATKARLTPRTAKTHAQICKLERDNLDMAGFWMLVEESKVTICAQRAGEGPTAKISIPKREFDRMVDFYNGV